MQVSTGEARTMSPALTMHSVVYPRTESILNLHGSYVTRSISQILSLTKGTCAEPVPESFGSWFSSISVL